MTRLEMIGIRALLADLITTGAQWYRLETGDTVEAVPVELIRALMDEIENAAGFSDESI